MLIKKKLSSFPIQPAPKNTITWTYGGNVIDGILVIDIYKKDTHKYRFFYDKKNFVFYDIKLEKWRKTNSFSYSWFDSYYCLPNIYGDGETEITVGNYFENSNDLKFNLRSIIYDTKTKEKERKEIALESRINNHTGKISNNLSTVNKLELNKNVFKQYLFVSNLVKGKRYGKCTCCGKRFVVDKNIRHKTLIKCPKCGAAVITHKQMHVSSIKEKAYVCRLENIEGRITYSYAKVTRTVNTELKYVYDYDVIAAIVEDTPRNKKIKKWYGYSNKAVGYWGRYWHETKFYLPYMKCYTFADNFDLIYGEINHIDVFEFINLHHYTNAFCMIERFKLMPELEYLYKLRLYNLVEELPQNYIIENSRSFSKALRVRAEYLAVFQQADVNMKEVQALRNIPYIVDAKTILKMRTIDLAGVINMFYMHSMYNSIGDLLKVCNIKSIVNYAEQQGMDERGFKVYLDYIGMCNDLNIDMSNKTIKYPLNYKEAHDKLVEKIKLMKEIIDKEKSKMIAEYAKDNSFNAFCNENYCIVTPTTHKDLIREGETLHHCVGRSQYWENHKNIKSMIFFIRKIGNPDIPYVTMEINMSDIYIVQIYADHDRAPADDVKKFGKDFCEYIKKQLKLDMRKGIAS